MTQEEINRRILDIRSHVDYTIGDWVETCNMLPGIVQSIDISFDRKENCFHDTVEIFYPHYTFNSKCYAYKGKSYCSITNCGIHKITPEYAYKLMAIGEEKLNELWKTRVTNDIPWKDLVEEYFKKL